MSKTTARRPIVEYLRAEVTMRDSAGMKPEGFHYSCMADLVLREGRDMPYGRTKISGAIKECYRNAFVSLLDDPTLTYCEGYVSSIIAVPHAWLLDTDGKVIETTLRDQSDAGERSYFGIAFSRKFVCEVINETGYYGVLDDWRRDLKLYREPLPAEARESNA